MSMFCSLDEPNTTGGNGDLSTNTTSSTTPAETNSSRELKIFKKVIRDPMLRAPFQEFLEQQFCAENLNFYLAVEQFKEINDFQERATFGRRIYDRYFAMNSTEPVNIDNSTSKRIRETVDSATFPIETFDVAQYQILHLLKYDCWPRFLRSTSITQPTFTDEELAAEDEEKHSLSQPTSLNNTSDFETTNLQSQTIGSTSQNVTHVASKEKRKSILWHGLDRFSRRLRRGDSNTPTSCIPDDGGDNLSSAMCAAPAAGRGVVGSAGSKRRYIFAASKQHSMPAEMTSPVKKNSLSPTHLRRSRPVEVKKCQLMVGDQFNTETVVLDDPTMSVRKWTQDMAEAQGMDKLQTEVVDAETGSTIDPARQAIDALQSRALRLVPVVSFIIEFLPPNFSFKNPSTTPTKLICVRARQSLSTGIVLRPLLVKYTPDPNTAKVVLSGSLEQIKRSISVGMLAQKCLTVLTDHQYNERMNAGKPLLVLPRDSIILQQPSLIYEQKNFQFHQHGDISYCEVPTEAERNKHSHQPHFNEVQNFSHQQKEYSISIFNKFVRKASHAVSKSDPTASSSNPNSLQPSEHRTGVTNTSQNVKIDRSNVNNNFASGTVNQITNLKKSTHVSAPSHNNNGDSDKTQSSLNKVKQEKQFSSHGKPDTENSKSKAYENIIPCSSTSLKDHQANGGNSNNVIITPSSYSDENNKMMPAVEKITIRHPAIFSTKISNVVTKPNVTNFSFTENEPVQANLKNKPSTSKNETAGKLSDTTIITSLSSETSPSTKKEMELPNVNESCEIEKESTWQPAAYV